jgi:hypothetical protein
VHLEKFYADVVTNEGNGCIGYAARVSGFGLGTTLAASLSWTANSGVPVIQRRTTRGTLPATSESGVAWSCPALGIDGRWMRGSQMPAASLNWREGRGTLQWQVLAPRAAVTLRLNDETLAGWGYAERLSLDFSPLRLPIDVLRWGRFVSPTQSAVWIEWAHETTRRWAWHNGGEVAVTSLDETGVTWPGHRVVFEAARPLRTGRLIETLFARWPQVRGVVPRAIAEFDEKKWCAPATLRGAYGAIDRGWVIYERVRFR